MRPVPLKTLVKVLLPALVLGSLLRAADAPEQLKKLNVAALDAHGQPVTDLTAADFQVFDDGKPQPILYFRFTSAKPKQATALGPREYSNRSGAPHDPVVILFDMLNDRIMGDAIVRTEIVDGLKNLETSDNIYLYLITPRGELFPVHPLPMPDTVLAPQTGPNPEPWTHDIAPILDKALKPFVGFHPVDELDIKNRYTETIEALNSLGGSMTEISGRRSLVWVTHGFPIFGYSLSVRGRLDFTDPLRNFYQRLALSQVLLYPVDQSRRGAGEDPTTYSAQTLEEASDITGGRRLTSDRASDGIAAALTDDRANYEIVYRIPSAKPDPKKRHKIRIATTRKDVRVQSANAYYVLPPVPSDTLLRAAFENAIHSPFEATDIGIRASVAPSADGKGLNLSIFVDPADLMLGTSGDDHTGAIDFMIGAYGASGLDQASKPASFGLKLTPQEFETASRTGLSIRQTINVKDTTQRVRVIVYDPNLNSTGSLEIPVKP